MNAAPIPGTDSKIWSLYPLTLQNITATSAAVIIIIECCELGLYPDIRTRISGMNIPPKPYTARTTSEKTELFPEKYAPKDKQVATNAITIVVSFVFL